MPSKEISSAVLTTASAKSTSELPPTTIHQSLLSLIQQAEKITEMFREEAKDFSFTSLAKEAKNKATDEKLYKEIQKLEKSAETTHIRKEIIAVLKLIVSLKYEEKMAPHGDAISKQQRENPLELIGELARIERELTEWSKRSASSWFMGGGEPLSMACKSAFATLISMAKNEVLVHTEKNEPVREAIIHSHNEYAALEKEKMNVDLRLNELSKHLAEEKEKLKSQALVLENLTSQKAGIESDLAKVKEQLSHTVQQSGLTLEAEKTKNKEITAALQIERTQKSQVEAELKKAIDEAKQAQSELKLAKQQIKQHFMFTTAEMKNFNVSETTEKCADYCIKDWEFDLLYKSIQQVLSKPHNSGNKYGTHFLLNEVARFYETIGEGFYQHRLFMDAKSSEKSVNYKSSEIKSLTVKECEQLKTKVLTHCGLSVRIAIGLQSSQIGILQNMKLFGHSLSPRVNVPVPSTIKKVSNEETVVNRFFDALDDRINAEKLSELEMFVKNAEPVLKRNADLIKEYALAKYDEKKTDELRLKARAFGFPFSFHG